MLRSKTPVPELLSPKARAIDTQGLKKGAEECKEAWRGEDLRRSKPRPRYDAIVISAANEELPLLIQQRQSKPAARTEEIERMTGSVPKWRSADVETMIWRFMPLSYSIVYSLLSFACNSRDSRCSCSLFPVHAAFQLLFWIRSSSFPPLSSWFLFLSLSLSLLLFVAFSLLLTFFPPLFLSLPRSLFLSLPRSLFIHPSSSVSHVCCSRAFDCLLGSPRVRVPVLIFQSPSSRVLTCSDGLALSIASLSWVPSSGCSRDLPLSVAFSCLFSHPAFFVYPFCVFLFSVHFLSVSCSLCFFELLVAGDTGHFRWGMSIP